MINDCYEIIAMCGMRTSSTFRNIARNRVINASRFFASKECPVWAPLRRSFVFVSAMRVAKIFSRAPVPDILNRRYQEEDRCEI